MAPEKIHTTVALIQALIPVGLQAVVEALQAEFITVAGPRYTGLGSDGKSASKRR